MAMIKMATAGIKPLTEWVPTLAIVALTVMVIITTPPAAHMDASNQLFVFYINLPTVSVSNL